MRRKDYWAEVCAPKLRAKKMEIGRSMSESEIGAAVEASTGKPSDRGLVGHWLRGVREPFISQFFALCDKLGADPEEVMRPSARLKSAYKSDLRKPEYSSKNGNKSQSQDGKIKSGRVDK